MQAGTEQAGPRGLRTRCASVPARRTMSGMRCPYFYLSLPCLEGTSLPGLPICAHSFFKTEQSASVGQESTRSNGVDLRLQGLGIAVQTSTILRCGLAQHAWENACEEKCHISVLRREPCNSGCLAIKPPRSDLFSKELFILFARISGHHMHEVLREARRGYRAHWTYKQLWTAVCPRETQSPLQEQHMFLTAEPSLQLLSSYLFVYLFIFKTGSHYVAQLFWNSTHKSWGEGCAQSWAPPPLS